MLISLNHIGYFVIYLTKMQVKTSNVSSKWDPKAKRMGVHKTNRNSQLVKITITITFYILYIF